MPPLSPQQIAIPFAGGVETRQDPKQVPPVRLLDLQNGVFTKHTTVSKRNGYRALSRVIEQGGGDYSGALALGARDDELLLFTANRAYSYREDADRWVDTGAIASLVARERVVAKTGTEQSQCDAATASGVTVVAWTDSRGGVWGALVSEEGRLLVAPTQLGTATSSQPRCVAVGTYLHVYYAETDSLRIDIAVADAANPLLGFAVHPLTGDLYESAPSVALHDGVSAPARSAGLIVWRTAAGYKLGYVTPDGQLGSALTGLPPVVEHSAGHGGPVGIATSANTIVVVWATADEATIEGYATGDLGTATMGDTISAAPVVSSLAISMTVDASVNGQSALLAIETTGTGDPDRDRLVTTYDVDVAVGSVIAVRTHRGLALASRLWAHDGLVYGVMVHDVPVFSVYLTMRLDTGTFAARTMPIVAHGRSRDGWLSSCSSDGDERTVPLLFNEQLQLADDAPSDAEPQFGETGIRLVTLDYASAARLQSAQLGRGLYLAGALPLHYDGDRWAEAGWNYAPDGDITPVPSASGGAMEGGTYLYRFCYEEIDALGEVHRGPVSLGTFVTVPPGSTGSVAFQLPTYRATGRRRVRIGVFRSEVDAEANLFRVTSLNPSATGANGYVLSDPTVDTVAFTDGMGDLELVGQTPLYTTGGVLSNDPPNFAGGVIAGGKNRLFWTDPADPTLVLFSQELQDGFAVDFAAGLSLRLDPYGGDVTAIGLLDDVVIPFKEHAVYAFAGPGPLAAPGLDPSFSFSQPALVTSDVGCTDPQSICQSPVGLVFKSEKGIELLDRGRQLLRIGNPVDLYVDQRVARATLLPNETRIVFLSDDPDGRTLLFDYEHQQWSTFTNHAGRDALVVGGVYHYLRTDERVFVETPGVYADDNMQIRLKLETAWIRLLPYLQGWHRFWDALFIGEYKSEHTLRIRFGLDYEANWSAPFDLDVDANYDPSLYGEGVYGDGPYGGAGAAAYQRKINIGKRGQAIRFRIEDVEETGAFGASFELSELLLTGGATRQSVKLSAARSS